MSAMLLCAERLGFAVPGRTLLAEVDLAVPRGRVLGLIGPNGSGKTTLLRLLARQLVPGRGRVLLDGRPVADWGPRAFAREVAYLPQSPPLGSGLLVEELVALGRYPWHGPLGRFGPRDATQVEEAMRLTQVEAFAGRAIDSLSGGERQRVWLAMLLAQETACLLLDEPTSALDVAHQVEILALVRELSRARGLAVLLVLHDVNLAARYCDDLAALRGGRLLAHGPATALMRHDLLAEVYGLPLGILLHPVTGQPMTYLP